MEKLPPSFIVKVSNIGAAQGPLIGEEFALLEGATHSRQREIIAGRVLARQGMDELGHKQRQLTRRSDGSPAWPVGICGSIAHSASHVAIAIALTTSVEAVGIDIEDGRNLDSAASNIGATDEIENLISHPFSGDRDGATRLLFSGKEALYKCLAPLTKNTTLDFLQIRINVVGPGAPLVASPTANLDSITLAAIKDVRILFERLQGVTLAIAWKAASPHLV